MIDPPMSKTALEIDLEKILVSFEGSIGKFF